MPDVDEVDLGAVSTVDRLELLVDRLDETLVEATTRSGIDETVCAVVADADPVAFAAVYCYDEREFTFRTAAGVDEETAAGLLPAADRGPDRFAVGRERTQVVAPEDPALPAAWRRAAADHGVGTYALVPVAAETEVYRMLVVADSRPDAYGVAERDVLDQLGRTVGEAVDALQTRRRERTLDRLRDATDRLEAATTPEAVYRTIVDVAESVLGVAGVGVFAVDEGTNELAPAAATDTLLELYGDRRRFGPGAGDAEVWQAHATGEPRVFDDLSDASHLANPDTEARSAVFVPLTDAAVFVAASRTPGTFDTRERRLVELLTSTATSALRRVESEQAARDRAAELDRQAARLDRLEGLRDLVRDVNRVLIEASSRAELERKLCERLADGPVALAWVGAVDPDADRVEPRCWAGDGADYLDDADLGLSGDPPEPAAQSVGEGFVRVDPTDHLRAADWAVAAADHGFQSACAVPLTNRGVRYGVLALYATTVDAFADMTETVTDLGETAGYGVNVVEARQGVLADRATELDLEVPADDGFLNDVAATAGEPVVYYELTPDAEGSTRLLFALTDPPVEQLQTLETETVAVESLTAVNSGDEYVFRVTVADQTVAGVLLSCGAIPREVTAHADRIRATVRVPQELAVREFLDRVDDHFPGVEMLARRTVDGPARTRGGFRTDVDAELTDRQLEVLQTAYESGFFESPRETTGAELADLLGVSQPTVTRHLREGQRRLFALLFEDDPEAALDG